MNVMSSAAPTTGSSTQTTATAPIPAMRTMRGFHTPVVSGDDDSDYGYGGAAMTPQRSVSRTRLNDVVSAHSSPMLRSTSSPGMGGISKLKLQLDTLSLDPADYRMQAFGDKRKKKKMMKKDNMFTSEPQSSTGTATPEGSDEEGSLCTSYEVPLEHDFVSPEVDEGNKPLMSVVEGGLVSDSMARKMTASDFEPLRCLGKGTYGTVLLVKQQSTGRLYAQKQFRKASLTVHKKLVEQTKTERAILESVNRHPFVVKLFYAFQDHEKLYLILEYAQGGELFTHLAQERMFSEEVASFYMAEMVLALEHLHRTLGVVYRDLKPENCLLDADGHLLLTDFGLSKVAVDDEDTCKSILGTVEYMAPEVVEGKKYSFAVDWWSFGALAFDLLTGSPPFQANNHSKILEKIVKSKISMPYFLSTDAKDLLTRLLRKDPTKRLGGTMPKDLTVIKKHRFFRKIDWKALAKRQLTPPICPLITDPELAENFSADFTDLALSPVVGRGEWPMASGTTATGVAGLGVETRTAMDIGMATGAIQVAVVPSNDAGISVGAGASADGNPFGGFSYVASNSLLEANGFC